MKPTELGEVTTKLMKERFPKIVNVKFTAQVENELDEVQSGKTDWVETLDHFYTDFDKTLKQAKEDMKGVKIQLKEDETDIICEKCGRRMVIKTGRYGRFIIACPGLPGMQKRKEAGAGKRRGMPEMRRQGCGEKIKKKAVCFMAAAITLTAILFPGMSLRLKNARAAAKTLLKKKGKKPRYYCITPDWRLRKDRRKRLMIKVIGAGLAGCEAAWQIAEAGEEAELYEMKPARYTPCPQKPTVCGADLLQFA